MNSTENGLRAPVSSEVLDQLFREARTLRTWLPRPVPETMLRDIYDLARMGPTSANCSPGRFVFVVTPEAKERLRPALFPGNVDKTMTAPATAVVAYDTEFYEKMPEPWPSRFRGNPELIQETAFRNGTLQGAYLILAARALGLDCGPMSGFDAAKVNQEFFPDGKWKANFLCNLGYGDRSTLRPREPRLDFEAVCRIL